MTYKTLMELFEKIASKHYQISSFKSGYMDEVDIKKLNSTAYPLLYAEPQPVTVNTGVITYNINLYIMELIQDDLESQDDAITETLLIMQDVIDSFKHSMAETSWVYKNTFNQKNKLGVVLETPITIEPFNARFDNVLTGWNTALSITANNTNNLCAAPINQAGV
jgi:hypothetical protein